MTSLIEKTHFQAEVVSNMSYPAYLKSYAPQINLPYPKTVKSLIYDFYEISETDEDCSRQAKCKQCGKIIFIIKGSHVTSSYTSGLTSHIQNHPESFQEFLDKLKDTIVPDNKSMFDHFQARESRSSSMFSKLDSSRRLEESQRNSVLNPTNCAGIKYVQRDIEVYRNNINYRHQNDKLWEYLHKYTNQNIPLFKIIGTNQSRILSTKQSKCLIDNDEDIVLDLEKLFCSDVCFFDPEYYDQCSHEHNGQPEIFGNAEYQARFSGFNEEIEKYPEFEKNKSVDFQILRASEKIETNQLAIREMNRLLKILLSILIVHTSTIKNKVQQIFSNAITEKGLRKPNLGLQLWGPKFLNFDIDSDVDASDAIPENKFSTFNHVSNADCPSYTDNSKKTNETARFIEGRAYYPCNYGSCLEGCICIPCEDPEKYSEVDSFGCFNHKIDHPEMHNEVEDLSISRRQFVRFDPNMPLYKRPKEDKHICPPPIKLARMKKSCPKCKRVFNDHKRNHHILHKACQICSHMKRSSEVSFKLACCICLKTFNNKYTLSEHMGHLDQDGIKN